MGGVLNKAVRGTTPRDAAGTEALRALKLTGIAAALCWASGAGAQEAVADNTDIDSDANAVPEVVVTATKRNEAEGKVAGSLTALTGRQLDEIGAKNFSDYLTTVPGVQFNQQSSDFSVVSIRGVTTSNSVTDVQTPVGIFFDEIPLTDPFNSVLIPDVDTFDAAQIEVLRGPQGALYGSGALGGAINYNPNRADAGGWDSRVEASGIFGHGGSFGSSAKAMVNVPVVSDVFAVRAVAYGSHTPGYIDNVGIDRKDSNESNAAGGRVMATWVLSDSTTLSLASLYQRTHSDDAGYVTPGLGDLQKTSGVAEYSTGKLNVNSLRLESDLGFAKLVGIGGYQYKRFLNDTDLTPQFRAGFGDLLTDAVLAPAESPREASLHGYTTELRLVSPTAEHFEWLAGAFYGDRREAINLKYNALGLDNFTDPITTLAQLLLGADAGAAVGSLFEQNHTLFYANIDAKIRELAVYADASYKFNSEWKLSVGGRGFHNEVENRYQASGVYELIRAGTPYLETPTDEDEWGFNPRVSLSYTPGDDTLLYALYSRGYALGGPNLAAATSPHNLPTTYSSSTLQNYELGFKGAWLDRRVQAGVTPFYMKWRDVPLALTSPDGLSYWDNGGSAHMTGVEGSLTLLPVSKLVLTATVTYLRSVLDEDYDPGNGADVVPAGTSLPGASRWQTSQIVTYKWRTLGLPSHASFVNRYVGSANSSVQVPDVKQGGYDTISLRGGLQWQSLGVELFADNLTDRRGSASKYVAASYDVRDFVLAPRTIGLTLSWSLQ